MTYKEIAKLIKSMGIPYTYYQFNHAQNPPFICFYYPEDRNFAADSKVYKKGELLRIELYTELKDFDLELQLENLLDDAELVYSKTQDYISSEKMFMQTYEMEVLINEQG